MDIKDKIRIMQLEEEARTQTAVREAKEREAAEQANEALLAEIQLDLKARYTRADLLGRDQRGIMMELLVSCITQDPMTIVLSFMYRRSMTGPFRSALSLNPSSMQTISYDHVRSTILTNDDSNRQRRVNLHGVTKGGSDVRPYIAKFIDKTGVYALRQGSSGLIVDKMARNGHTGVFIVGLHKSSFRAACLVHEGMSFMTFERATRASSSSSKTSVVAIVRSASSGHALSKLSIESEGNISILWADHIAYEKDGELLEALLLLQRDVAGVRSLVVYRIGDMSISRVTTLKSWTLEESQENCFLVYNRKDRVLYMNDTNSSEWTEYRG